MCGPTVVKTLGNWEVEAFPAVLKHSGKLFNQRLRTLH